MKIEKQLSCWFGNKQ